ncbi:aminopeptidase [Idiomarina tyrosinivorans]|uniref:Aminopeptidase N n=1 Tax=Idiomarina tyrosinivorans TaxID=1445662 RepID=A0A432ZS02_9GAMM|nr:M1 family metallopeptidase [Idiomarina tyrosinivorans]RUO80705.1 aminopeptidase [Idiomarina tyrosinivorans]
MKFGNLLLLASAWLCLSVSAQAEDQHSYANLTQVSTPHLALDINVDFAKQVISGTATYQLQWKDPTADAIHMDTRELTIKDAQVWLNDHWQGTTFTLAEANPVLGSELTVALPKGAEKLKLQYQTAPTASGLQWLTPAQTAGKKNPFMFSQSQPIHARSWIPIQDTPALRLTYDAHVTTRDDLLVLMSASNDGAAEVDGDYQFEMPQPIPPYLIAIAAGDMKFKAIDNKVGVYAEPGMVDDAAWEFADTPKMIDAAESLYGPYRWGRYDLLILPPSFPFGGMENPRLSFITPTVVAGDRSLVNLIAHELAHSWSGNLVTNASWRDLWLNEGFTSYVENRIMEALYGKRRAVMEQVLGYQDLQRDMASLPAEDTVLNIELGQRNPDDVFSNVPYVKGQLFLMYLEDKFGRATFDKFLRNYFDSFAFQSITTQQFQDFLARELLNKHPGKVSMAKVNQWLHEPGLPEDAPHPTSDVFDKVAQQQRAWLKGASLNTADWTTHEWLYFINTLPQDLSTDNMRRLDDKFALTESKNAEIAHAWLLLGIKKGYEPVKTRLRSYLQHIGRNKLVVPLYQALAQTPDNLKLARQIYAQAKAGYHPLTQHKVEAVLHAKP